MTQKSKPEVDHVFSFNTYLNWGYPGCGFGQLSVSTDADGKFHVNDEFIGRKRTKEILYALVDKICESGTFEGEEWNKANSRNIDD